MFVCASVHIRASMHVCVHHCTYACVFVIYLLTYGVANENIIRRLCFLLTLVSVNTCKPSQQVIQANIDSTQNRFNAYSNSYNCVVIGKHRYAICDQILEN